MKINFDEFKKIQGDMSDVEFAKKLNISRTQLWRVKNNKSKVGQEFICKFKQAFPDKQIENFFDLSVT